MTTIALPCPERPADLIRRMVCAGLMLAALVFALSADVRQFEGSKECRGSFAVGFSSGFDGHRCDLVIRRIGSDSEYVFRLHNIRQWATPSLQWPSRALSTSRGRLAECANRLPLFGRARAWTCLG